MNSRLRPALWAALFLCAFSSLAAQTTVLTFDVDGIGHNFLPQDYGDRVTSAVMGGNSYGGSGTFTPNVTLSHGGSFFPLTRWTTGYNGLVHVAENDSDGDVYLRLALVADAGFQVSLNSFDIGNYWDAITVPAVRVKDGLGNILFEEWASCCPRAPR